MKIIFIIATVSISIILLSTLIGNYFSRKESLFFYDVFVGFSVLMSVYFVITHYAVNNQFSSSSYHLLMGVITIILLLVSLTKKLKIIINKKILFFLIMYLIFSILLSVRYTLGEQMGDSIFLFFIVNKNIEIDTLNAFDLGTGLVSQDFQPGLIKSYVSFYMMFSSLYHYLKPIMKLLDVVYIPPYVINVWVTNILFYFFSAGFILDLKRVLDIKKIGLICLLVIWLGLYNGSIYYNVTLPHIVVTFLGLYVSYLVLLLYQYFQDFNWEKLVKISVLMFAMNAFGGTGALFLMVFAFGIVSTTILLKKRDAFIQIPLFLLPILEYVTIMVIHDYIWQASLIIYFTVLILCFVLYRNVRLGDFIFRAFPYILAIFWFILFFYSVLRIDLYPEKVISFINPQYGLDRTQDYFSFTSLNLILRNIFYYILIAFVVLFKKTRSVGTVLLIFITFFINPLMKPIVAENIARYDVYNRIFFTLFNTGSIGLGLYAMYYFVEKHYSKQKKFLIMLIVISMLVPTWHQVTTYYYSSYVPQVEDYNPLYKMGESQIDILEAVRQIVEIEELENPILVSQIFGTAMYAPEFVTLGYNVNQQRYGPMYIGQQLYEIFYTPAIPGDHRIKINTDLRTTCQLLVDINVDFVVIDKSFSVYDETVGDYLTIYWYVERCGASFVKENDDYIAYRFYRW